MPCLSVPPEGSEACRTRLIGGLVQRDTSSCTAASDVYILDCLLVDGPQACPDRGLGKNGLKNDMCQLDVLLPEG